MANKYFSVITNKTIQAQESHLNHKYFTVKSYTPITATTEINFPSSGSWTVPEGTVSATFYVWGAGGGGAGYWRSADGTNFNAGCGGGGAGFGQITLNQTKLVPGTVLTVVVGAAGVRGRGNARINQSLAQGGNGGYSSITGIIDGGVIAYGGGGALMSDTGVGTVGNGGGAVAGSGGFSTNGASGGYNLVSITRGAGGGGAGGQLSGGGAGRAGNYFPDPGGGGIGGSCPILGAGVTDEGNGGETNLSDTSASNGRSYGGGGAGQDNGAGATSTTRSWGAGSSGFAKIIYTTVT